MASPPGSARIAQGLGDTRHESPVDEWSAQADDAARQLERVRSIVAAGVEATADSAPAADPPFAQAHGPTVLLVTGVALCLGAIAATFAGHGWAPLLAPTGVVAIFAATVVARLVGDVRLLGFRGFLPERTDGE